MNRIFILVTMLSVGFVFPQTEGKVGIIPLLLPKHWI